MRGKDIPIAGLLATDRITPAYAGKSGRVLFAQGIFQDHPRVCGEKPSRLPNVAENGGSPPRMRGKAAAGKWRFSGSGITPAYAGKR